MRSFRKISFSFTGYIIILLTITLISGCKKEWAESFVLTPDWTEETHGNSAPLNYDIVLPEGKVIRFEITISSKEWARMQGDLKSNIRFVNNQLVVTPGWTPVWASCSFRFNGREWYKVGIRYKGNSSLKECIRRNIRKYAFKLDFDEFENQYPVIKNQRFYGFKQLNLSNGFDDISLMREKSAADLFREFNIPSAKCAFCEVWIDYGEGLKYFGLYTLIEEVEETVINNQFEEGGNLYKPEGPAATFACGTFNIYQLFRQNNTVNTDYSDVRSLYEILHSPLRTSNSAEWKSRLEEVFDVHHFLRWLAANTVMQNWDTYGKMNHNYYLYNNPATGKLTWIPWDNNEALRPGKQGGALSLSFSEVTDNWPLIRFLINDSSYFSIYKSFCSEFITTPFSISSFSGKVYSQAELIGSFAKSEEPGYTFLPSPSAFDTGLNDLLMHVQKRVTDVKEFTGGKGM
ncbi:MAG: CotH kinase family protein [Bacteroidales bacterium]